MLKRLKQLIVTITAGSLLFAPALVPVAVSAAPATTDTPSVNSGLCQGANLQISDTCDVQQNTSDGSSRINGIITTVINIFSLVVGVVAVIMIIIGGLKYITSGGDSGNITGAKNTILYAVIGLVVVALAQFIVKFVLNKATKDPGTSFILFFR